MRLILNASIQLSPDEVEKIILEHIMKSRPCVGKPVVLYDESAIAPTVVIKYIVSDVDKES